MRECFFFFLLQEKRAELLKESATNKSRHGCCTRNLDEVLNSIRVQRQAYYSGAFIGNHVKRCLEVKIFYKHI